jgi:hypothetical protein
MKGFSVEMQEAQLVIEQLIWLTNLSENIVKPQNTDENLKKSDFYQDLSQKFNFLILKLLLYFSYFVRKNGVII